MALITFTPSVNPSPGTRKEPQISLNEAEFGDGYAQVSPRGINHIREKISLRWEGLTEEQFNEIEGFFYARGGFQPFYYQPHGYTENYKWLCKEWRGSDSAPWKFEAVLWQDYTNLV